MNVRHRAVVVGNRPTIVLANRAYQPAIYAVSYPEYSLVMQRACKSASSGLKPCGTLLKDAYRKY